MLALALLTQHPRRFHVGRALIVGAMEQADGAQKNGLGSLHWTPALRGGLVAVLVLLRRVQNRNAQLSVFVDVGMERDRVLEGEGGRHVRIRRWEDETGTEVPS